MTTYGKCLWMIMDDTWQPWINCTCEYLNVPTHRAHVTVRMFAGGNEDAPPCMPLLFDPTCISTTDYPWGINARPFHAMIINVVDPPEGLPVDAHLSLAYRVGGVAFTGAECAMVRSMLIDVGVAETSFTPAGTEFTQCDGVDVTVW